MLEELCLYSAMEIPLAWPLVLSEIHVYSAKAYPSFFCKDPSHPLNAGWCLQAYPSCAASPMQNTHQQEKQGMSVHSAAILDIQL